MGVMEVVILLIIAGICGSLGQAIAGFNRGGCLVSIVLGFIGALIGIWLARTLKLPELLTIEVGDGVQFPVVWSVIGCVIFVAVISFLTRRRPPAP